MIEFQRAVTPKTILFDLLGVAFPQPIFSPQLAVIANIFSVPENSLRVALSRLVEKGWVNNDVRGEYHLTEKSRARNAVVRAWREADKQKPWDGQWLACHLPKGACRSDRNKTHKALGWYGFKPGLDLMWVRPDNLALSLSELTQRMHLVGLEPDAHLFVLSQVDDALSNNWQRLWPVDQLNQHYQFLKDQLINSSERMKRNGSLKETCLIGGEAIHCLVKDPQLPKEFSSPDAYQNLRATMLDYDQLGREIWFEELTRLGVHKNK